jgi:hypothetical protein
MPPREVHVQVTHSMPPQKIEIFKSMENWADQNILVHLKPVEKCWQPQDFLPDPASDGFHDQVRELRKRAKEIPDEYFVCLVGDMITEEALPTYQTMLNTLDGVRDETGASPTSWAVWTRAWTAEENRHGDLLNKYLYLTGRVDMRQIEKTIQYLIGSGMVRSLPHKFMIFVSNLLCKYMHARIPTLNPHVELLNSFSHVLVGSFAIHARIFVFGIFGKPMLKSFKSTRTFIHAEMHERLHTQNKLAQFDGQIRSISSCLFSFFWFGVPSAGGL